MLAFFSRFFACNGVQHCFWMALGVALFIGAAKKRPLVLLRAALVLLFCMTLSFLIPPDFDINMPWQPILWFTGAFLLASAGCFAVCEVSFKEAMAIGSYALLTEHIASSLYILIFVAAGKLFAPGPQRTLVYAATYLLIYLTFGRRMLQQDGHLRLSWHSVVVTSVMGLTVSVVLSMLVKRNIDLTGTMLVEDAHMRAILQTSQLYAICFCCVMLLLQYIQQKELRYQRQLAQSHEMWKLRQEQYHLSRENIDLINRKCHDMKHQLSALMAQDGDNARKEGYAKEIDGMVQIYDMSVDTKNEALNTIVMEKGLYCSMHGIHWTCAADGSLLDFIDFMDLYTLLGNALDNAIEAVEKLENPAKRMIQLQLAPRDGFMHIRIENSMAAPLKWKGDMPVTSKADQSSHGFGLRSIRDIAQKYQGFASFSEEDGVFILSILIPLPHNGHADKREETFHEHNVKNKEKDEQ